MATGATAAAVYRALQARVCDALEAADGAAAFGTDVWGRAGGGGGTTRVLTEGALLEKAAVNTSDVSGAVGPALVAQLPPGATRFSATGLSLILHPHNPYVPTLHANVRYLETDAPGADRAWFGGGTDLTPWYLFDNDARGFHAAVHACCARHPGTDYAAWKKECDRYFFLAHRGEARGVGGIFFDRVAAEAESMLAFQEDLGDSLLRAWLEIAERRRTTPYGPDQERWHQQRRGRYVEFNLLADRGTRFGLASDGRTESILVSLPPRVRWDYAAEPAPGTPEAELVAVLRRPRDWVTDAGPGDLRASGRG